MTSKITRAFFQLTLIGLSSFLCAQPSFAQTFDRAYGGGDCGSEDIGPPPGFKKSKPIEPRPPKEKQRRKYAVAAAEKAINAGYNYVVISPLIKKVEWDMKDFVERSGFGNSQWEKVRHATNYRTVTRQKCLVIDDYMALHLIWSERLPDPILRQDENFELMDAREFLRSVDSSNPLISKPVTPKIAAKHYKSIGDKERIAAQYPVMAAAASCRADLGPHSLTVFKRRPEERNKAAERQCLEQYRAEATATNWTEFPLFKADLENTASTRGFTLNKPKTTDAINGSQGKQANSDIWGAGWTDLSDELRAPSGAFLFDEKRNRVLIASNAIDENLAIDHAVFLAMGQNLRTAYSGLGFRDKTAEYRKDFESKKRSLLNAQQKDAEKAERAKNRSSSSNDRKIGYLERDIERAKQRISEISEQNDEAMIAQMKANMAAFPDAKFDEAALRTQLKSVRDTNLKNRQAKLKSLQDKLAALKAETATSTAPDSNWSNPATVSDVRPSKSTGSDQAEKGIYNAFETYNTVLILETSNLRHSSTCRDEFLVCADKLQAYNAIGPRLGKSGFTQMSEPAGYKPYLNR